MQMDALTVEVGSGTQDQKVTALVLGRVQDSAIRSDSLGFGVATITGNATHQALTALVRRRSNANYLQ